MRNPVVAAGVLLFVTWLPNLQASQPTDSIAYALDAHSGTVRMLSAQDMKRHVTVPGAPTYRVQATTAGPIFELSFADIDQGSGIGFDHPSGGPTRIATVQAVFEYVSSLFPMHSGTARIHFEPSITDPDFLFSGQAFPFFPGYPCDSGYQKPLVFDAIVNDRHLGEIDGSIILNFGPAITWNDDHNRLPGDFEMDLYSLLLHEVGHALGFLGFAFDETSSRIFCDGQAAFPNLTRSIRDEDGEAIWTLVNGVPTFSGDAEDLSATTFASVEIPGIDADATRLHKNGFVFEGEILRSFSGHWHPNVNVLMSNAKPSLGIKTTQFSPVTISLLNDVIGYGGTQAVSLLGVTGSWYDPISDGRGFNIQFINDGRFIIYFYGFLDNRERFWLIGDYSGEVRFDTALEITMLEATGGLYNNFNSDNVSVTPWGSLTLTFNDCDTAVATLVGPEGIIVFNLVKLAGVEGLACQ